MLYSRFYNGLLSFIFKKRKNDFRDLENNELLSYVTGIIRDAFFVVNPDWSRVLYINPAFENIFGIKNSDIYKTPDVFFRMIHPDDMDLFMTRLRSFIENGNYEAFPDIRIVRPDRTIIWLRSHLYSIKGKDGDIIMITGITEDISEQKKIEEELRFKNAILLAEQDVSLDGILIVGRDGEILHTNREFRRIWGLTDEMIASETPETLMKYAIDQLAENNPDNFVQNTKYRYEQFDEKTMDELIFKDGRIIERYSAPIKDVYNEYIGRVWYYRDITEHRIAEEKLCTEQAFSDNLMESLPGLFYLYSTKELKFLKWNKNTEELLGADVLNRTTMDWIAAEARDAAAQALEEVLKSGEVTVELPVVIKDGTEKPFLFSGKKFYNNGISYIISIAFDITDRKNAEDALRKSELHLRTISENAEEIIHMIAWDGTFIYISPSWERYTGFPVSESVGKVFTDYVHPDDVPACLEVVKNVYETGLPHKILEFRVKHASGKWIWFMNSGVSIKDENGKPLYFMGVAMDITERKLAEDKLIKEVNFSRSAFDSLPGLFYLNNANGKMIRWNKNLGTLTGYTDEEIAGMSPLDFFSESEKELVENSISEVFSKGNVIVEASIVARDGTATPHVFTGNLIYYEDEPCLIGVALDNSDRKHLEEQLIQSQKMEAVGQLAGGMAHDFNNLLQVILGYIELIFRKMEPDDAHYNRLLEVKKASERAASLTKQLLAFSRRQVLQIELIDINEIIGDLLQMLNRLIGEDIELVYIPCKKTAGVKADKSQIEQVLINLCVNARDAMPGGGRIVIETLNIFADDAFITINEWARPGPYICIMVTDSGTGMDRETMQHVFEPFFTTKEKGKGTGLGLSMVYGIINQHQGMVKVYSEPGSGTCFSIYLPGSGALAQEKEAHAEYKETPGGTETILLAEDDDQIRELASGILTDAGYHVITAGDGISAEEMYLKNKDEISLLFLDIVMPGQSGRSVYEQAKTINPAIKCLFASGYNREGLHKNYILEEGIHLLQKPYTRDALLRILRQLLDE